MELTLVTEQGVEAPFIVTVGTEIEQFGEVPSKGGCREDLPREAGAEGANGLAPMS